MRTCISILGGFTLLLMTVSPLTLSAQSLPTCAQLVSNPVYGLAGNPTVIAVTGTLIMAPFVPYCQVDFTVSERGGPQFGYAPGEIQRIGLRVGLPVNTADGGTGGGPQGQGAWNGRVRNLGGGGLVGSIGPMAVVSATSARYVGSFTDSGHTGGDPAFGVIQETNQLNLGKIGDFYSESIRLQYQWALRLANTYYGKPAIRNYWDGCSTGGRQGLVLATKYGNDFDGFLIGAPHTNHSRTSSGASWRSWVNQEIAGGSVAPDKITATVNKMISQCDAQDGVVDGLLSDPRTCKASATLNVCGQPGASSAPACLNWAEAKVIDMAMDGARNDLGQRVWVGYGRGSAAAMSVPPPEASGTGGNGIFGWANKDMTYDFRVHPLSDWDDVHQLGTRTVGPYIDMGSPNLDLTKNRGGKILMWHGLADQLIPFEQNIYYYNKVIDNYQGLDNVTPWFRFFLAPGVTHCGGGVGPQPPNLFNTMVDWVENGNRPDSILASGGGRTRPLCPFPQTAIYDGVGDPNLPGSFHCGGNLQTKQVKCDGLLVKYQEETGSNYESLGGVDAAACGLVATQSFTIPDRGGVSSQTGSSGGTAVVSYGRIQANAGSTTPSGLAIIGYRQDGVLVSEATVPASPLVRAGRIYADVNSPVNTGMAIANPNDTAAALSYYFTDENGQNFGAGTTTIPANGQIARFLNEAPFNGRTSLRGTFTFSASVPVSALALRVLLNERSEVLITTLPVVELTAAAGQTVYFPHFADGGGWATQIVLINPTDDAMSGTVQFFGPGSPAAAGQPVSVTVAGQTNSTFSYVIPPRSSRRFLTSGQAGTTVVGSVRVVPAANSATPSGVSVFSFKVNATTVSEAGVPALRVGSAFRMYVEASGTLGQAGSIQSGIAITNPSASAATVNFELTGLDGRTTGFTGSLIVPASGQVARFLNQISGFETLPLPFQGVLRVTTSSSAGISLVGLRIRYNERADFLITTTPPVDESVAATSAEVSFPHFADGGGWSTQFILFSGSPGQSASGVLRFVSQSGQPAIVQLK